MKYLYGIDIGGTTVKMGLFAEDGTLKEKWEIKTRTEENGKNILPDIAVAVNDHMKANDLTVEDVIGLGVGVPGAVLEFAKVNECVNLGWDVVNVEKELEEKTGLLVKAGNDANVAALGEMWQGGGKGYQNVVMVTLGTGVGGGIIVGGKIIAGANGAGGELGHIHMDDEETECCGCGRKGCLEQYASATGIVRMAKKKLQTETRTTKLTAFDPLTAKDIFDVAKEGDEVALELVDKLCTVLGTALANVAGVVDPEVFVIGGGVSRAGDILIEGIQKKYSEIVFQACRETKVTLATLGNDAGMYGCVKLLF